MNVSTGEIHHMKPGEDFPALSKRVEVTQDNLRQITAPLTERQKKRGLIGKYEPCPCRSGKKFKFCCYRPKVNPQTKPTDYL